ncbi:MAG TPA: DUF4845 domain-containing protein [Gammaproteobacteria bacterium]
MLQRKRQLGMTFMGYVILLAVIGFFAIMVMKLAPVYLEYQSVVRIMNGVAAENGGNASPVVIRDTIQKRLDVNNIDTINARDFKIRQDKGDAVLSIEYEARTKFIGNLWFLLEFDHAVAL